MQLAKIANRYVLLNGNAPQLSSLPRGDRDSMEEFIGNLRTLLGVMGHKALESIASHENIRSRDNPASLKITETTENIFDLNIKGIEATSIVAMKVLLFYKALQFQVMLRKASLLVTKNYGPS